MSKHHWKNIYAILASDGKVKIGTSKNVTQRIKSIEYSKGINIIDVFETESCSNPFTVERICHELFRDKRTFGEWFLLDFDTAVKGINHIYEKYARFEETSDDISRILTAFFNSDEVDKDETIGMLAEIVSRQSNTINEMVKTTMRLSQAVTNISDEMTKIATWIQKRKN